MRAIVDNRSSKSDVRSSLCDTQCPNLQSVIGDRMIEQPVTEYRKPNIENRISNIEYRTSKTEHRTSNSGPPNSSSPPTTLIPAVFIEEPLFWRLGVRSPLWLLLQSTPCRSPSSKSSIYRSSPCCAPMASIGTGWFGRVGARPLWSNRCRLTQRQRPRC